MSHYPYLDKDYIQSVLNPYELKQKNYWKDHLNSQILQKYIQIKRKEKQKIDQILPRYKIFPKSYSQYNLYTINYDFDRLQRLKNANNLKYANKKHFNSKNSMIQNKNQLQIPTTFSQLSLNKYGYENSHYEAQTKSLRKYYQTKSAKSLTQTNISPSKISKNKPTSKNAIQSDSQISLDHFHKQCQLKQNANNKWITKMKRSHYQNIGNSQYDNRQQQYLDEKMFKNTQSALTMPVNNTNTNNYYKRSDKRDKRGQFYGRGNVNDDNNNSPHSPSINNSNSNSNSKYKQEFSCKTNTKTSRAVDEYYNVNANMNSQDKMNFQNKMNYHENNMHKGTHNGNTNHFNSNINSNNNDNNNNSTNINHASDSITKRSNNNNNSDVIMNMNMNNNNNKNEHKQQSLAYTSKRVQNNNDNGNSNSRNNRNGNENDNRARFVNNVNNNMNNMNNMNSMNNMNNNNNKGWQTSARKSDMMEVNVNVNGNKVISDNNKPSLYLNRKGSKEDQYYGQKSDKCLYEQYEQYEQYNTQQNGGREGDKGRRRQGQKKWQKYKLKEKQKQKQKLKLKLEQKQTYKYAQEYIQEQTLRQTQKQTLKQTQKQTLKQSKLVQRLKSTLTPKTGKQTISPINNKKSNNINSNSFNSNNINSSNNIKHIDYIDKNQQQNQQISPQTKNITNSPSNPQLHKSSQATNKFKQMSFIHNQQQNYYCERQEDYQHTKPPQQNQKQQASQPQNPTILQYYNHNTYNTQQFQRVKAQRDYLRKHFIQHLQKKHTKQLPYKQLVRIGTDVDNNMGKKKLIIKTNTIPCTKMDGKGLSVMQVEMVQYGSNGQRVE